MTELVFSFDTEDFTNPVTADAILREAEVFEKEGVRGCFCVVGKLAENLRKWGRTDVIEAMKRHEIDLHSYGHSLHPTINEYTDIEDFDEAVRRVTEQETKAIEMIKETFGDRQIYAAVPPGNQKSYAAMHAYAKMGIPIYADTFCDDPLGDGAYWCNIFHMAYTYSLETFIFGDDADEQIKNVLDDLSHRKRAIIYTHPHTSMTQAHWDILNFYKENLHEEGDYVFPEYKTPEHTELILKNIGKLLRAAKNDKRFKIVTYKEISENLKKEPVRTITLNEIPAIRDRLKENFYPIDGAKPLSLADITLACADMLNGKTEHICSDVCGPMSYPEGVKSETTLTADEVKEGAKQICDGSPLPANVKTGDKTIGLADWLFAALDVLCGEKTVKVTPKEQIICLDRYPLTRDCSFKGKWIQSDSLEDNYLSDRLKLQSWTMRLEPTT